MLLPGEKRLRMRGTKMCRKSVYWMVCVSLIMLALTSCAKPGAGAAGTGAQSPAGGDGGTETASLSDKTHSEEEEAELEAFNAAFS